MEFLKIYETEFQIVHGFFQKKTWVRFEEAIWFQVLNNLRLTILFLKALKYSF